MHPEQLKETAIRKQDEYAPLLLALCHYIDEGWTVKVFLWVIGIRGLIDPPLIIPLLTFLDIPSKHRKAAIELTVLVSGKALYFMHQVRFGGINSKKRSAESRQHASNDEDVTNDEELRSDHSGSWRKRLAQASGRKPAGPQRVQVSSTWLSTRRQSGPAKLQSRW